MASRTSASCARPPPLPTHKRAPSSKCAAPAGNTHTPARKETKGKPDRRVHCLEATLFFRKVNLVILVVAHQVPKGKSNSFSCPGNRQGPSRVTAAPVPTHPTAARPRAQETVAYYGTFAASDYLANKPI